MVERLPANAGDAGLIPGSGRSPGGGHGNLLQYSRLENPMDGGAWLSPQRGSPGPVCLNGHLSPPVTAVPVPT